MSKDKKKSEIVKEYLKQYPNMAKKTLATKIYEDNKLIFKDPESVRTIIRLYTGSKGKKALNDLADTTFLDPEKRKIKYNLPESITTEYTPYKIIGEKGLVVSDIHVPFHSINALETMFMFTEDKNMDFVILNGDIMDCFDISFFCKEPNKSLLTEEREKTKQLLKTFKEVYPNAKIYYKFGNHEKRFEQYLMSKAPELWGFEEFRLHVILDLFNLGIEYIPEDKYIDLMGLSILHGHEYKNAISSPANPARTLFLRTKGTALCGHHHQTSEHTETRITGEVLTCWSLGCMSELHPKYMPLNKWNHGFAVYEKFEDDMWFVRNKRIIKGQVV